MNEWQLLKQIRHLLRDIAWADGTGSKVFRDSVIVSSGGDPEAIASLSLPAAMIRPGGSQADAAHGDNPTSLQVEFTVRIFQKSAGDRVGEHVLLGVKQPGVTSGNSAGKGLFQIEELVYSALSDLHQKNGVDIIVQGASSVESQMIEGSVAVAARDLVFTSLVTTSRTYPKPPRLLASPGPSTVSFAWALPPSRFDFLKMKLRSAIGGTPPSSHIDGSEVTITNPATDTSTSFTGSPSTEYSFSLFALYDDERETPSDELRSSSGVERTVTTS